MLDKIKYPECIKGKGACPPEDCGGVWGYDGLCQILSDKSNDRYEEYKEYYLYEDEDSWDPFKFDLKKVQQIITKVFQ